MQMCTVRYGVMAAAVLFLAMASTGCMQRGGETPAFDTAQEQTVSASNKAGSDERSGGRGMDYLLSNVASSSRLSAADAPIPQQLIFNSELTIKVVSFRTAKERIDQAAEGIKGYVAETRTSTNADGKLNGTLTVRVPSDSFAGFVTALAGLGDIVNQRQWTEDVTEEYIDVATRIANQQQLEQRLLELLKHPGAKLKDLIEVEGKLSEVRTGIEQSQGRLRYLQNRISFSTVTVNLYEPASTQDDRESSLYPLQWALHQVGALFFGSVGVLTLCVVGIIPWVVPLYFLIRILIARRRRRAAQMMKTDASGPLNDT